MHVKWQSGGGFFCEMVLKVEPGKPLIESLTDNGTVIARDLNPVFRITTGSRKRETINAKYTFFDRVFKKEDNVIWSDSTLLPGKVTAAREGIRTTIDIPGLSAGLFYSSLQFHVYDGSPLVHVQAVMTLDQPETAYCYEMILESKFKDHAWCGFDEKIHVEATRGDMASERVRYRAILGYNDEGTVALFPPPHAFLYPKDEANNFGFVQSGTRGIGICQPVKDIVWNPLFDAPPGKYQRMGAFLLLNRGDAASTLERVKRYTHGDTLKEIEGHTTLITHEHAALTVHDRTDKPRGPSFVNACKKLNVKIIQLAEFHGDGLTSKENDSGIPRMNDHRDMNATCRKYSDKDLLILPGEEPNCSIPGHWIIMFPKPVIFTRKRAPDQPFKEDVPGYGTVYHLSDADSLHTMLKETNGLAWTAHARIKSSRTCPDEYKETAWYQSPQFLGATWKAMPADLSQDRLGSRCLDLLDDMNLWGQKKFIVGEFDCFRIDEESEFYGNVNASYLRLKKQPTVDDWSPVLDCLRTGDYFVSTGEVLIHSWKPGAKQITADVEWTFPLAHVEIVMCDGKRVERKSVPVHDMSEFGRRTFEWPVTMNSPQWVRLEVWDIANNGAFTQPHYLR